MKAFALILLACVSITYLSGCANHLDPETRIGKSIERKISDRQIEISTNPQEVINEPVIEVSAQETTIFHVIEYEKETQYDLYTPYQGWREFYEVPMGIVLLPVAVIGSLVPSPETSSLLDFSVAGMNPFLNIENKDRTEKAVLHEDKKILDERDEVISLPLAGAGMTMEIGSHTYIKNLDAHGKLMIDLLDEAQPNENISQVMLSVKSGTFEGKTELLVTRQMNVRLQRALQITSLYPKGIDSLYIYKGGTVNIKGLAHQVIELSSLGFEKASQRMESLIIQSLKPDDKAAFDQALKGESILTTLTMPLN